MRASFFFGVRAALVWMLAYDSSVCVDCCPLDRGCAGSWPVHSFREIEAVGRAYSQCLAARPLTVARTHGAGAGGGQAASGCRALGNVSDSQGGRSSA